MPSESDDDEPDDSAGRRSADDRSPEERARAAADAIEAVGVDRLTDLVVEAWEEGGLPPFDDGDDDGDGGDDGGDVGDVGEEPTRSAEEDETGDEGAR